MPVVSEFDPRWAEAAAEIIAEVRNALPDAVQDAEHIGSTAVPGLAAKPVIDVMVSTPDLALIEAAEADRLVPLGYQRRFTGMSGRLFYRRDPRPAPPPTLAVHLHVVPVETWETRNERLLRDHLCTHPEDAARYAELKRGLAGGAAEGEAYTRAKTALIQELVDAARTARGLPVVDVWET